MLKQNLWGFYNQVCKGFRLHVMALFIFATIWCICETFAPYTIKIIIDDLIIVSSDNLNILIQPTIWYVSFLLLMEISIKVTNVVWIAFIPKLRCQFRSVILENVLMKPMVFFENHAVGDLVGKFKNLTNSFDLILSTVLYGIFPVFVSSFLTIFILFSINKIFCLFFTLWFLGMNVVTFLFAQKNIELSHLYALSENKLLGYVGDLFRNIIVIKTSVFLGYDQTMTEKHQLSEKNAAFNLEKLTFQSDLIRSVLSILMFLSIVYIFFYGFQNHQLTLGDFSFVTMICFYLRRSAWIASVNLLKLFKEIGNASESLGDLIDSTHMIQEIPKKNVVSHKSDHIQFKSVDFAYEKNKPIFSNLNLCIPEGQRVLIVGPSGSGKTTLISLLVGLLLPDRGNIHIGSVEDSHKISYVPQNMPLFHRTVEENIAYGNPDLSFDQIVKAAKLAEAHDFIMNLEKGYQTVVGENGIKLSGGQRQRIAIARSFAKRKGILILDEATSAIDPKTEAGILQNILQSEFNIVIMVAHQPIDASLFDQIFFLKDGKIKIWIRPKN
jgi:ATP-binding cassette, subfamily B, bacterial